MGVTTTQTNKPLNPRGNDQSPLAYNRAKLFSGKALDFDGVNDLVTATGSNTLSFSQITMSAYLKFDNISSVQVIFHKRRDVTGYQTATFTMRADGEFWFATATGTTEYKAVYSGFVIGEFYHVVGVSDGSNNYLYINGQLVDTTASGAIENTTTYDFVLGDYGTGSYFFNGQIANAKAFNTALTAAQVADLYNNPEKVVPTGVDNTALKLWLPMQEGAGTTAYDGSGNGNHGTISGATYVHGIGAPVSQTAVIDWNKGTNLISDSEDFSQWSNLSQFVIYSTDDATAPDGQTTADKITEDTSSNHHRFYKQIVFGTEGGSNQSYTISGFVKYIDRQYISIGLSDDNAFNGLVNFDLVNGTIEDEYTYNGSTFSNKTITDAGNDWWKFSVTLTSPSWAGGSIYAIAYFQQGSSVSTGAYLGESKSVHVWGWNAAKENYITSYVPTFGTAQTSPVLLPQGLTTGRDITGVNLFENVRKQGALNLDGNSWAEVHDNESLDMTDGISLECWVYWNGGISDKGILGRYVSATPGPLLYVNSATSLLFFAATNANINYTSMTTGWRHIVGTYNKVNSKLYIDGALVNTGSQTDDINLSANPFAIGRYNNQISKCYPNDIAQPRIYNRALTAEEVQRNYNAGKNIYTN